MGSLDDLLVAAAAKLDSSEKADECTAFIYFINEGLSLPNGKSKISKLVPSLHLDVLNRLNQFPSDDFLMEAGVKCLMLRASTVPDLELIKPESKLKPIVDCLNKKNETTR